MTGYERNLVLVHTRGFQSVSDFEAIKAKLAVRAPEIEVFIFRNGMPNSVSRRQASRRPTLFFSPVALVGFEPLRGKVYAGRAHRKMEEIERLVAGGIRVPDTLFLEPNTVLDPKTWGPFTVLKPNQGRRGNGVRLRRTRDVRWVDPKSWPADDPRFGQRLIAQKFVDTGPFTAHHRVMTVFGRPAYSTTTRWEKPRSFALDPDGVDPLDEAIAAQSASERTLKLNYEDDILAFGSSVSLAFPEIPVLGVDVVREEATGELFALETNPGGQTWHISSDFARESPLLNKIDVAAQFGALDIIADSLIDVTRCEAE